MVEDNSHAGQGAVLLDIGGDVGALVVTMPAAMEGVEVEIRPVGAGDVDPAHHDEPNDHDHADQAAADNPAHDHGDGAHDHGDGAHDHGDHDHGDHAHEHGGHDHSHTSPWPHVAVVARPAPVGIVHSLVYPGLTEGAYELYVRPHGPVELTVEVTGGYVTEADWPV